MADGDDGSWGPHAAAVPPPPPPPFVLPPPPGAPLLLETAVVRRTGGRGRLAVGALVALALVVGGLALVARTGDDKDAEAALRAAQAVVEGSESYRFELLEVTRSVIGDPDGAGSDTTTRSLTTGTIAAPDRWRLAADLGEDMGFEDDTPYETIRVGDELYSNDPFSMTASEPTWVATPVAGMAEMTASDLAEMYGEMTSEEGGWFEFGGDVEMGAYEDEFTLDVVMAAYLLDMTTMQPTSLTRLVTEASDPGIEERLSDGGVRLRTTLAPIPELAAVADEPIPPVEVLLDLNAADEPVMAQFTAVAGGASARIEVRFSDWGAALRVDPPAEANIDRTPWITEEAIAELDAALLIVPSVLPDSLELTSATVYDGEEVDEPGCDTLELGFESEASMAAYAELDDFSEVEEATEEGEDFDFDYLYVSVTARGCDSYSMLADDEFDEELGGLRARGVDGMWDVMVGDAVVTIDATYDDEVLAALAASLAPMTPEEIAASIPEWAADSAMYSGMMGTAPGSMFGL